MDLITPGTELSIGSEGDSVLPHRIATSGPPRSASAWMAVAVTASHPVRRCEPDSAGLNGEHAAQHDPWSDHAPRSPCGAA
jgi:hypothetical protein